MCYNAPPSPLSSAESGIFRIISLYIFSISLSLCRSPRCLSVLELMGEFKILIQSQNIRLGASLPSSLSAPASNPLIWWASYLHYYSRAGFESLTHTSHITSTCLTVTYCVWPCSHETVAWSSISTYTHHQKTEGYNITSHPHFLSLTLTHTYNVTPHFPSSIALFVEYTPVQLLYFCVFIVV